MQKIEILFCHTNIKTVICRTQNWSYSIDNQIWFHAYNINSETLIITLKTWCKFIRQKLEYCLLWNLKPTCLKFLSIISKCYFILLTPKPWFIRITSKLWCWFTMHKTPHDNTGILIYCTCNWNIKSSCNANLSRRKFSYHFLCNTMMSIFRHDNPRFQFNFFAQ